MRLLFAVLLICAAVLTFSTCISAVEMKTGEQVSYGKGETVDEDLLLAGNQVTVESNVNGDITAAGSTVTVSGPVSGSTLLAGAAVNVAGEVDNDAWLAGSQVNLGAPVRDNAYLVGSTVTVTDEAQVGRDLLIGGSKVDVLGDVGRNLRAAGSSVVISGTIGRNAYIQAQSVTVTSSAVINGNLYYPRDARASIAKGAVIRGEVIRTEPAAREEEEPEFWSGFLAWFGWLIASILFGIVLVLLFPHRTQQTIHTIRNQPWPSLGIGFLALIVVPVTAVIFIFTIIGIPIGIALLLIYPVLLYAGYILAGVMVGQLILQRVRPSVTTMLAYVAVGILALSIVGAVPILGGLIVFIAILTGFGAMLISWWQNRQLRSTEATPPPVSTP